MSFAPGAPQPYPPVAGPAQPVAAQVASARSAGPGGPAPLVGCVPATPGRRAAAAFTDGLVSAAPTVVAAVAVQVGLSKGLPGLVVVGAVLGLAWLVGVVVVGLRFVQTGASPGKRAMGLRLVDLSTGGPPGFGAWGRFALAGLGSALAAGWVLAVVQIFRNKDGERRTWYDTMTGLVLLDVEAGRDPFFVLSGGPAMPALAPRSGASQSEGLSGDAPTWMGPAVTSLAPGQHGTQFGQQHAGGLLAPPPPAPFPAPFPEGSIPDDGVRLPPVPPPPPLLSPPPPALPPAPAPQPAPFVVAATPTAASIVPSRATFTFASGQVLEAAGAGVIGRAPRPSRTGETPAPDPGVLTVTDVTRTVSKAHLSFRVEATGVWLTDLGSTNGSTIIGRFGVPTALVEGTAVLAAYGSTVTVGELSFTLASVPASPQESDDIERTIHRDRR